MASRVRVEEHEHAYLVRGTNLVEEAKQALFKHLGRKKWTRIAAMPARPLWTGAFEEPGESAVALYFNIGDCDCCEPEDAYRP